MKKTDFEQIKARNAQTERRAHFVGVLAVAALYVVAGSWVGFGLVTGVVVVAVIGYGVGRLTAAVECGWDCR